MSIGEPKSARHGAGCIALFGAAFFFAGLLLLVPFFLLPAKRALAALGWREVPCTVLASRVETVSGDDGDTYRVAVAYEYEVDGRTYRGDRYDFLPGSSSGRAWKQAIVDRNPPGTRTVCWVDPDDPAESVFSRAWRAGWLVGLVPLVFAGVGAGMILLAWKSARGTTAATAAAQPAAADAWAARRARELTAGPVTLRPRHTPLGKLVGTLLVMLFWNGIVAVFVWQLVRSWRESGDVEGCLALFLVPFVLVGLLLAVAVPYQLLALFNPRPRLTVSRAALEPGDTVHLEWRFAGLPGRIRRLRIALEGREETVRQSGDSSSMDRKALATVVVIDTAERSTIPHGSRLLGVPADARPSETRPDGRIVWVLAVRGEIAFWPDVNEDFEIEVLPRAEA